METGGLSQPKNLENNSTNAKIVEEVFKKYHQDLIRWCISRLIKSGLVDNLKMDAEEIVSYLYERLLRSKKNIDLTRDDKEIQALLKINIRQAVSHYLEWIKANKRNPSGGFISLDEALDQEDDGEQLTDDIEKHLGEPVNKKENEEMYDALELALLELEKKDQRLGEIVKKKYPEGRQNIDIAKDYNITYQRVGQLTEDALAKIRASMLHKIGE